ncbi:MAG: SusC/RagA family TonB-linked outer membrane protein, partial [Bacteroidetes bacterium]
MRKIASLLVMLMLFQVLAFSQDRTIAGVVKDESGLAVPGASIRIKGTKVGTAADNQGHFRIQAKAGDILLITAAGIDPAELTVGSSDAVSITVKNKIATGSEVVVTALGI